MRLLFILLLFYCASNLKGQGYGTYWYNGTGRFDVVFNDLEANWSFTKKPHSPRDSSYFNNSILNKWLIAPSSISDKKGTPALFFHLTRLYNSNFEVIYDFDTANEVYPYDNKCLRSLFVPHPGNDDLFFLFLSGVEKPYSQNGSFVFKQLTIDITGNNGKGSVVENKNLFEGDGFGTFQATEKKGGYWLVFKNDSLNNIYVYNINEKGLDTSAVFTKSIRSQNFKSFFANVGTYGNEPKLSINGPRGKTSSLINDYFIKFNPNGEQFCFINKELKRSDNGYSYTEQLQSQELTFYSFDRITGAVKMDTKSILLDTVPNFLFEYSSDGKYIFIGVKRSKKIKTGLYRFNLDSLNFSVHNKFTLDKLIDTFASHGVLLSSNNKLYYLTGIYGGRSKDNFNDLNATDCRINEIQNPNTKNVNDIIIESYKVPFTNESTRIKSYLSTRTYFPYNMYFKQKPVVKKIGDCMLDTIQFKFRGDTKYPIVWHFGDGTKEASNVPSIKHLYTKKGIYMLKVISESPTGKDTIERMIEVKPLPIFSLPQDTLIFKNQNLLIGQKSIASNNYIWNTGDSTSPIHAMKDGKYKLTVSDSFCSSSDSFVLHKVDFYLPPVHACGDDEVSYNYVSNADSLKAISNASINKTSITFWQDTATVVRLFKNGLFIDSLIPIERSDYPVFKLGSDTVVCKANGLFVKVIGTSDSVKWRDGNSSVTRLLNESKRYFATAYNNNCSFTDSINLIVLNCVPQFNLKCLDSMSSISLDPNLDSFSIDISHNIVKQQNNNSASFAFEKEGYKELDITLYKNNFTHQQYERFLIKPCECHVFVSNAFTPNGDGVNDVFKLESECQINKASIEIYNRWGELIYENKNEAIWDGTFNYKKVPMGSYMYMIRFIDPISNAHRFYTGQFTILN